jgi:hypothetical protein
MANIIQKIINFVFHVDSAIADATGGGLPTFNINNPLAVGGNIEDILDKIITDLLMPVGFSLAGLMYLWAGFQFLTAGGQDKKITTAKQTLIWTTIGVMVILAAKGIVIVVKDLLTP